MDLTRRHSDSRGTMTPTASRFHACMVAPPATLIASPLCETSRPITFRENRWFAVRRVAVTSGWRHNKSCIVTGSPSSWFRWGVQMPTTFEIFNGRRVDLLRSTNFSKRVQWHSRWFWNRISWRAALCINWNELHNEGAHNIDEGVMRI